MALEKLKDVLGLTEEHFAHVEDRGGVGSEGEEGAEFLPAVPVDDGQPLGDTDQHSQVPSPPAQRTG